MSKPGPASPSRLFFPGVGDLSGPCLDALVDMINRVYVAGEGDLFGEEFQRTSRPELDMLIAASQLLVLEAQLEGDTDSQVHGCMYLKHEAEGDVLMFGMLAVSERSRGLGFARQLLDHAEQCVRDRGCVALQLTLLSPTHEEHAHKRFLEAWYRRRGFEVVRHLPFNWPKPLAKVCEYRLFSKNI
jgi:GNAT superfamily N-acetyltransferase